MTPDRTTRLSTLDRFLPLWIGLAMAGGTIVGRLFPGLDDLLEKVKIDTVSLPIALGLLAMMYPVLAKVDYSALRGTAADKRPFLLVLALNWLVGPFVMFVLAWTFLGNLPEYRTGLIIVGLAPCIAMVIIWIDLAAGNNELAAIFVAINSIIQVVAFSMLGYFYLEVLPSWTGKDTSAIDVSMADIAKSVAIFLGVPLVAGWATRRAGTARKGSEWYEKTFVPRIGPIALYGLLFTIVVLFALQGNRIWGKPTDVLRISVPLLIYFVLMWGAGMWASRRLSLSFDRAVSVGFTAAGNNFELAIAVCIGVFGVSSGQALAGVVGPLIEVPVLVSLVYVARRIQGRWTRETLGS